MTAAAEALARIERWVAEHCPSVMPMLDPDISEEAIVAAEAALGFAVPEEIRALYRRYGGSHGFHNVYPAYSLQPLDGVVRDWREICNDFRDQHDRTSPFHIGTYVLSGLPASCAERADVLRPQSGTAAHPSRPSALLPAASCFTQSLLRVCGMYDPPFPGNVNPR